MTWRSPANAMQWVCVHCLRGFFHFLGMWWRWLTWHHNINVIRLINLPNVDVDLGRWQHFEVNTTLCACVCVCKGQVGVNLEITTTCTASSGLQCYVYHSLQTAEERTAIEERMLLEPVLIHSVRRVCVLIACQNREEESTRFGWRSCLALVCLFALLLCYNYHHRHHQHRPQHDDNILIVCTRRERRYS